VVFPIDSPKSFAGNDLGRSAWSGPDLSPLVSTTYNNSKKLSKKDGIGVDKS